MGNDFDDLAGRQDDGLLQGRENQEVRAVLFLKRAQLIWRSRVGVWGKWIGVGLAAATALTQVPAGIAKLVGLFLGKP